MLIFDSESDGLVEEATVLHCLNMIDRTTGRRLRFNDQPDVVTTPADGTIADGLKLLMSAPEIAGQNVLGHDLPLFRKLYPWFRPVGRVHDTLTYSKVIWTQLYDIDQRAVRKRKRPPEFVEGGLSGRHSLEAWGYRLGTWKGDYAKQREVEGKALGLSGDGLRHFVWGTFTAAMDDYCAGDCETTLKLIEKEEAEDYDPRALALEVGVQEIINLQERHGFLFDRDAAEKLQAELVGILAELDDKLRAAFPPWFVAERKGGQPIVVDPKRRRSAKVETEEGISYRAAYEPGEPYCKVKLVSFEPSSRDKIADRLTRLFGWRPQEFTPTGKPEVNETTLDGLDYPEAKLLKQYLTVDKRLGQLATGKQAWLKAVREDGRIHGRVNTNGAVTGRMTHNTPNMAQVPAVQVDDDGHPIMGLAGGYGYEMRSLFVVPPGKKLVGTDAEGLELRMLAHYMAKYDGGAYVDTVVNGSKTDGTDVHSVNRRVIGLRSRYNAKTWMYAYLYGAGNWKLGSIAYDDMSDEQRAAFNAKHPPGDAREKAFGQLGLRGRRRIETGLPALGALQDAVKSTAKRNGYLKSLDGRRLHVRAQHSALNTLLQGGGAVVMKQALVRAYGALLARGWVHGREFAFVVNVHDEFQKETNDDIAEEVGQIVADAIRQAGEDFGLRCPLAGAYDVGRTWAETH